MRISSNTVVTLHQRVSDAAGTVIDDGAEPVCYLHGGYGDIFAAIEQALTGKAVGDHIQVALAARDAFGAYDPALVVAADPDQFDTPPANGTQVERRMGEDIRRFRVTGTVDGKVMLDGNHPLAGLDIVFAATVAAIRPATAAEIAERQAKAKAEPGRAWWSFAPWLLWQHRLPVIIRPSFHSQTHRLCWLAPTLLLPAAGGWAGWRGWESAALWMAVGWIIWTLFGWALIGGAIHRWGEQFLVFDFSPNPQPSPAERRVAMLGGGIPLLVAVIVLIFALVTADSLADLMQGIGADVVIFLLLGIVGNIIVPFVLIVASGFRFRPVIDDPPVPADRQRIGTLE